MKHHKNLPNGYFLYEKLHNKQSGVNDISKQNNV